jgi:hypothetical protein
MYNGCSSKNPFALVITESSVNVELFLAAEGKVGILTEDQQDLKLQVLYYCGSRKGGFANLSHCLLRDTI